MGGPGQSAAGRPGILQVAVTRGCHKSAAVVGPTPGRGGPVGGVVSGFQEVFGAGEKGGGDQQDTAVVAQ